MPPLEPGETLLITVFLEENRFDLTITCWKVGANGKPYEGLCDGPNGEINRDDWNKYYKNFETTFTIYTESYPALDTAEVMVIEGIEMLHCSKYGPNVCHTICTTEGTDCQMQECPQCYYFDIKELDDSESEITVKPSLNWPPKNI